MEDIKNQKASKETINNVFMDFDFGFFLKV